MILHLKVLPKLFNENEIVLNLFFKQKEFFILFKAWLDNSIVNSKIPEFITISTIGIVLKLIEFI